MTDTTTGRPARMASRTGSDLFATFGGLIAFATLIAVNIVITPNFLELQTVFVNISQVATIAIVAVVGPSLTNAMIAVSITQIPVYVRLTRSVVLSTRELEYIQAANALGASNPRILLRHLRLRRHVHRHRVPHRRRRVPHKLGRNLRQHTSQLKRRRPHLQRRMPHNRQVRHDPRMCGLHQ